MIISICAYRNFQSVESKCTIRPCIKIPASLGPPPEIEEWGSLLSISQFGLDNQEACISGYPSLD